MNLLTVIIIAAVLLGIAIFGLAIQVIFKKDHKFPDTHVGHNKNMRKLGVTCAQTMDKKERLKVRKDLQFKNLKLAVDK